MLDYAWQLGTNFIQIGKDFGYDSEPNSWQYWSAQGKRSGLPMPALRGHYQLSNASACIVALEQLRERIPVEASAIRSGLLNVELPGRFQVLPGRPTVVLDVAHNPQAARSSVENLDAMGPYAKTYAVFSMLKDKDIRGVIDTVKHRIDHWLIAPITETRGTDTTRLKSDLENAAVPATISVFGSVAAAYTSACKQAGENDRIIVFGSFLTVADVMRERQRLATAP